MRKIFLSSTAKDLAPYREAVTQALHRIDNCHCVRMEDFGARDASALSFCQQTVQDCDVFVGVLGLCYGSSPRTSPISYTEHEYEAAVTKGLPRFFFLSSPALGLPRGLDESPEQRLAQERFRLRVADAHIVASFSSPEELAIAVTASISNWLMQNMPSRPAERELPGLGPLVAKMCNRAAEEASFKTFFNSKLREAPGLPQVYILRGPESERADSFVERVIATAVQVYANLKFGESHGTVLTNSVDWPQAGDPAQRLDLLRANIFKEFDPTYEFHSGDFSPDALARLISSRLHPIVALYHEIRANRWSEAEPRLLAAYLDYWDQFGAITGRTQMIIFLNVIYREPRSTASWWNPIFGRKFAPQKIERKLLRVLNDRQANVGAGGVPAAPCLLLRELNSVSEDDVMQWFKRHHVFDDMKIWQEKCREIFKDGAARNMAEIEFALKSIHREFLNSKT